MKAYKKTPNSYLRSMTILFLAVVLFSSCLKNSRQEEPQEAAALNVVNASPGPLTINFFLDNNLVNGPALGFGQESSYILVKTGNTKFDASTAGTFNSLVTSTLSLNNDKYYSIFISGENTMLSTLLTEDDLTAPASGKAKIRFINLSPDGGTFQLSLKGGNTLFIGQAYKMVSAFATIDPSAYMLELENPDGTVIHTANLDVAAGRIYTVWAGGLKNGTENTSLKLWVRANN